MQKIAILASGSGSNAQNIMEFCDNYKDRIEVRVVVTDNPSAHVIERARKFNKMCVVHEFVRSDNEESESAQKKHEYRILETLREYEVEWVCLAGYMRVLSKDFLEVFYDRKLDIYRAVNIHPSLLPSFKGVNAYLRAFEYGVRIMGATLHLVDSGVDTGPVIAQGSFERSDFDTLDAVVKKGLELEHQLYSQFLGRLINKNINIVRFEKRKMVVFQ